MGGARYGEDNPRAVLTDADVELMRRLWDSETDVRVPGAKRHFWTTKRLAEKFEIGRTQVRNILYYQQRTANRPD